MKREAITVYKRSNGSWQRYIFKNAYVCETEAITPESGGVAKSGRMTARIFSHGAEVISPGDRVVSGIGGIDIPENALLIKEVRKNGMISKKHIRITAV